MMKLKIEEVLEYLEAGADDPHIEQRLKDDPDGPELLRQAKLMFDMLGRLPDGGEDDDGAEEFGAVAADVTAAYSIAEELPEPDMFDESESDEVKPLAAKEVDSLTRLTQMAAGRIRDLGQLCFEFEGDNISLSYIPELRFQDWSTLEEFRASRKGYRFSGPDMMKLTSGKKIAGTMKVRASGFTISAPENLTNRGVVPLEFTESRPAKPARALELIFMPESGPFTRFVTNSKGIAEMPVPEGPGVLRIESKSPQLLYIRVRK